MSYSICKNSIIPYESLWSIVHKFSYWNVCCLKDIQLAFHRNEQLKGGWIISSLLTFPRWEMEKIAEILGIDINTIEKGVIETYLCNNEILKLSCRSIRYCPDCVSIGFHSAIHQIYAFTVCPYHQTVLTDKCIHCGGIIDPGLNAKTIQNYYSCQRCQQPLYEFVNFQPERSEELIDTFTRIGELMMQRKIKLKSKASLPSWNNDSEKFGMLWPFWNSCYQNGKEVNVDILNFQSSNEKSILNVNEEYRQILLKIENMLESHTDCIKKLLQNGATLGHLSIDRIDGICEIAYAYIIWRLYWESESYYASIGSIDWLRKREDRIRIKTELYAIHLPERVAKSIFEYECKATWISSLRYAQSMSKQSQFYLPGDFFTSFTDFYWEVSSGPEESNILASFKLPTDLDVILPFDNEHLDKMSNALIRFQKGKFDEIVKFHPRH